VRIEGLRWRDRRHLFAASPTNLHGEANITDWCRQTFGDVTSAFRFDEAKAGPPSLRDSGG
jgi:hypothetical protein